MKSNTLAFGIVVALVFAIAAPVVFIALKVFLPSWLAFRALVSGGCLCYAVLLALASGRRGGRIVSLLALAFAVLGTFAAAPPLWVFLIASAGAIWLARALLVARSIAGALFELLLVGVASFGALASGELTGSLLASVWIFFLMLAAGAFRARSAAANAGEEAPLTREARFERAHRVAEEALSRLAQECR